MKREVPVVTVVVLAAVFDASMRGEGGIMLFWHLMYMFWESRVHVAADKVVALWKAVL